MYRPIENKIHDIWHNPVPFKEYLIANTREKAIHI